MIFSKILYTRSFIPILIFLFGSLMVSEIHAQTPVKVSVSPGFLLVNTDKVSGSDNFSETQFIYGGSVSFFTQFLNNPVQLNIGYNHGKSAVYESFISDGPRISVDQRYNTIPVEALFIYNIADRITAAGGINTVMQYRTILFNEIDNDSDRILSFGAGLSAQIQFEMNQHFSGRMQTLLTISGRWTEFFLHNSRGRDTSDYRYRHILLAPQLSFRFTI